MRLILLSIALCIPLCVSAYVSAVSAPLKATEVLTIDQPTASREFFGKLDGFPHTYTFAVGEDFDFKTSVLVHAADSQKNDVSIILVAQERRGVSEIGRTNAKNESWAPVEDSLLVESFKYGGTIEAQLEPGTYILEVSSPNNDGLYRLTLGEEEIKRGYIDNLRVLFEVKQLLQSPFYTVFLSPLLYIPILLLLVCVIGFFGYRKYKKYIK